MLDSCCETKLCLLVHALLAMDSEHPMNTTGDTRLIYRPCFLLSQHWVMRTRTFYVRVKACLFVVCRPSVLCILFFVFFACVNSHTHHHHLCLSLSLSFFLFFLSATFTARRNVPYL
jgi:hypothetical protein